jgi:Cu-processing system permease protein
VSTMTLASFHLRGATRTRWVSIAAVVFAAAAVAVTLTGLRSLRELGLAGAGAATEGLLHLGLLLPPLIGLLLGAGTVARDRERGLLAVLATQPVARAQLPFAAFVGSLGAVASVIALGFGTALVFVAAVASGRDLVTLLLVTAIALAATASAVALGVLVSTLARSHHQATVVAAALWLLLALGMDLLLAGVAPGLRLGPTGLLVAVLANPLEAGRVLALVTIDHGSSLGPFGAYLTDVLGRAGAVGALVGSLVAWTLLPLAIAARAIGRRDI